MKLCEFENCKKIASYALYFNKPILCKEHKKDDMKTKTCICVCGSSSPSFGLKTDERPSCCSKCRNPEMIDLKHKKCVCGKHNPAFGLEGDNIATCCSECKTPEMINIVSKKCKCKKSTGPSFGLPEDTIPTCCSECRTLEMIDIKHKKCICGKSSAAFGLEGDKIASCCSECRTSEMINLKNKKCICGKAIPYFGLVTDKMPTCCKECRSNDMINIKDKRCICGKSCPYFGLEGDKIATCCKECKSDKMINIKDKKCFCGKAIPIYGLEEGKIATCCKECKTDEMINIKHKKCKSNYLENGKSFYCETQANKKYKGYCSRCYAYHFPNDPLTFQIRCKTKELAVRDYINANFSGFQHDKSLWIGGCDCTHKRRIDHRKLIGNTLLCIETDEEQHKRYNKDDEEIRYDDLMMLHGGKFIFIRFNPDKYKEKGKNKNPMIATRLPILKEEINNQIKRIENEENIELLEEIFMYYDN